MSAALDRRGPVAGLLPSDRFAYTIVPDHELHGPYVDWVPDLLAEVARSRGDDATDLLLVGIPRERRRAVVEALEARHADGAIADEDPSGLAAFYAGVAGVVRTRPKTRPAQQAMDPHTPIRRPAQ